MELLVSTILADVDDSLMKPVTLLPKYADFANMFDKRQADVLAEHSQYNLAIEIERDKILLFDPTYNHNMLKLEVLCEYINKMLAKKVYCSL